MIFYHQPFALSLLDILSESEVFLFQLMYVSQRLMFRLNLSKLGGGELSADRNLHLFRKLSVSVSINISTLSDI